MIAIDLLPLIEPDGKPWLHANDFEQTQKRLFKAAWHRLYSTIRNKEQD
jgi:hypothetical protein